MHNLVPVSGDIFRANMAAYHGTSVERLSMVFNQGRFQYQTYLAPINHRLRSCLPKEDWHRVGRDVFAIPGYDYSFSVEGALGEAKNYSVGWAFSDYLAKIGLLSVVEEILVEREDPPDWFLGGKLEKDIKQEIFNVALKQGHSYQSVERRISSALARKGVIIGISREFFNGKSLSDFEINDFDFAYPRDIDMPERISVDTIGALHFFTSEEKNEFLAFLQGSLN